MDRDTLRIATRQSPLAIWQAEEVARQLKSFHPELIIELVRISTRGDKVLDSPLAKIGGKGLFVKELEHALLRNTADIAVHSMKDVPMDLPQGLQLPVILQREDPRDAFVSNKYKTLEEIPAKTRIGTSSLRRQCQIMATHPETEVLSLRGNVNTRLNRLDAGHYDAIILASAGLKRLGLSDRITESLDPAASLPAIGQGAIGIECRINDDYIHKLINPLHHTETAARVSAERCLNARLSGGCQVPIAGFAEAQGNRLFLRAIVGYPDGTSLLRAQAYDDIRDAEALGYNVAQQLLDKGADKILKTLGIENRSD